MIIETLPVKSTEIAEKPCQKGMLQLFAHSDKFLVGIRFLIKDCFTVYLSGSGKRFWHRWRSTAASPSSMAWQTGQNSSWWFAIDFFASCILCQAAWKSGQQSCWIWSTKNASIIKWWHTDERCLSSNPKLYSRLYPWCFKRCCTLHFLFANGPARRTEIGIRFRAWEDHQSLNWYPYCRAASIQGPWPKDLDLIYWERLHSQIGMYV